MSKTCGVYLAVVGVLLLIAASGCASTYEVTVDVEPEEGGEIAGEGVYQEGGLVTVEAAPEEGYEFVGWLKDADEISSEQTYTFEIDGDIELRAEFKVQQHQIYLRTPAEKDIV